MRDASKVRCPDLLEVITKFNDRRRFEHPVGVDNKLTMLQRVDVALDEKQIGTALHRKEARARYINTMCIPEMLDSCSCSGLELWNNGMNSFNSIIQYLFYLYNGLSIVRSLGVDNDLKFHAALVIEDALQR